MLFVFLNNKLITADTIVPLLVELKRRSPAVPVEFICFEPKTEAAIRENTIVHDALVHLGPLRMLGRRARGRGSWLAHRVGVLGQIARMGVHGLFRGAHFLHFKALNEWPLRTLFLLNPKRTYLFAPSNLAHSETERRVDQINKERRHTAVLPAAGRLVGFDQSWPPLSDPRLARVPRHVLPAPFRLQSWHEHVRAVERRHLGALFDEGGVPDGLGVFVLSSMDPAPLLAEPELFCPLFVETLEALQRAAPELAILIKPHPATLPRYRTFQEETVARQRAAGQPVFLTHLHPLLLAQRARFFIGNMFSSTFVNAAILGVPTIEYTHYSEVTLQEAGGGSIRPDLVTHFINARRDELERLVGRLSAGARSQTAPDLVTSEPDLDELLDRLGGGPAAREANRPAGGVPPGKTSGAPN